MNEAIRTDRFKGQFYHLHYFPLTDFRQCDLTGNDCVAVPDSRIISDNLGQVNKVEKPIYPNCYTTCPIHRLSGCSDVMCPGHTPKPNGQITE